MIGVKTYKAPRLTQAARINVSPKRIPSLRRESSRRCFIVQHARQPLYPPSNIPPRLFPSADRSPSEGLHSIAADMGDEITIDKQAFHDRLSSFISQWTDKRSGDTVFGGVGSIVVLVGKATDQGTYNKSAAFQLWLLGYEFPATLMVMTPAGLTIVTTKKKAAYLEPLKGGKTPVEVLVRGKDPAENAKQFEKCLDIIKNAGKKVGVLPKDVQGGPFAEEWKKVYGDISKDVEEVDAAVTISTAALSVKDEKELVCSTTIMQQVGKVC